jgi:hypothetical protein
MAALNFKMAVFWVPECCTSLQVAKTQKTAILKLRAAILKLRAAILKLRAD